MTSHDTPTGGRPLHRVFDPERLARLKERDLLDSPTEAAFDRLTRLATRVLRTPVALVSLVDERRQFFKSAVGLPEPWATYRETPLTHSFCKHVVATGEPLIVSDSREHELVAENMAVSDLGVICYAGIPIETSGGEVLGAFCVIDGEPRDWHPDDLEILTELTRSVSQLIEDRFERHELRDQCDELSTSQVRLTEELASSEEANAAKSRFLAHMSHEIRTPLNGIVGLIEVLQNGEVAESEKTHHLRQIRNCSEHLLGLINSVLDLSKIEAGEMDFSSAPVDPWRLVCDAVEVARPDAERKNIVLDARWIGPRPAQIESDEMRLRQVLFNLIGNAIKFTDVGCVRVLASLEKGAEGGRDQLLIEVSDTGRGIGEEHLEMIFDSFRQADESNNRREGGTGLGLTISRHIAEALGGSLNAESRPEVGSVFRLRVDAGGLSGVEVMPGAAALPTDFAITRGASPAGNAERFAPGRPDASPDAHTVLPNVSAPSDGAGPIRVLVVEDVAANRLVVQYAVAPFECELVEATNGREGVNEAVAAIRSGAPFDLIVMDMQMPILDGYSAVAELRESGIDTPILAVTANAVKDELDRCQDVGCNDVITKPYCMSMFRERFTSLVSERGLVVPDAGGDPSAPVSAGG